MELAFINQVYLCDTTDLNLELTLESGQTFTWKYIEQHRVWINFISNQLLMLSQMNNKVYIMITRENSGREMILYEICVNYFRLNDENFEEHFSKWETGHPNYFDRKRKIRLLRQDALEVIMAFICSQNNTVKRITGMVDNLKKSSSEKQYEISDCSVLQFPTLEQLSKNITVAMLTDLKFGYRAKYIYNAIRFLIQSHSRSEGLEIVKGWAKSEKRKFLLEIPGIGPKVADCILLMGFDSIETVPIDTHMFKFCRTISSSGDSNYEKTQSRLEGIFGPYAGWAHLVFLKLIYIFLVHFRIPTKGK